MACVSDFSNHRPPCERLRSTDGLNSAKCDSINNDSFPADDCRSGNASIKRHPIFPVSAISLVVFITAFGAHKRCRVANTVAMRCNSTLETFYMSCDSGGKLILLS
ncbi:hypothetical protein ACOME3_009146 [Neoechinorhynchus agilis]